MSEPDGLAALVVVGTPIGNLGDLSPRAAAALADADVIACEDTRRTLKLLNHLGLGPKRMVVVNEHTEAGARDSLLSRVEAGESVVLVSDAGMPGVSDPGQHLIAGARSRGIRVDVVPGPSAVITALVSSGLATDRFVFEGFLPRRGRERKERLRGLATDRRTTVLFESPRRLGDTLRDLADVCGPDREATVARELTKLHEEVVTAPVADLVTLFADGARGEVVLVVSPASAPAPVADTELVAHLVDARGRGLSTRDAVAEVVAATGAPKRHVYALAVGEPGHPPSGAQEQR